jgi:hypothetical protein
MQTISEFTKIEFPIKTKEDLKKMARDLIRETSLDEVSEILSETIKEDQPVKLITFLITLLTYTNEDQQNLCFKGESSGGKSYNALEIADYFPRADVMKIAYSSPTAFFHDRGEWDPENKQIIVSLKQKILIFLDQPHDQLLQRLRPLLSHDTRELLYKITDKKLKSGTRTKHIMIQGYPTVIFCTAKMNIDPQERTRMFLLSPETSEKKLEESLYHLAKKLGNREKYKIELSKNDKRSWLRARIKAIKDHNVRNIIIKNPEKLCERFILYRQNLIPRHQRDFPRLLALIKAHALLNCFTRKKEDTSIIANQDDINAGFTLYENIVKSNELGLSPEVWEIFKKVIRPNMEIKGSSDTPHIKRKDIQEHYFSFYHRPLSYKRLNDELIPALTGAGIIYEDVDPEDRRYKLIFLSYKENESRDKYPKEVDIEEKNNLKDNIDSESISNSGVNSNLSNTPPSRVFISKTKQSLDNIVNETFPSHEESQKGSPTSLRVCGDCKFWHSPECEEENYSMFNQWNTKAKTCVKFEAS